MPLKMTEDITHWVSKIPIKCSLLVSEWTIFCQVLSNVCPIDYYHPIDM